MGLSCHSNCWFLIQNFAKLSKTTVIPFDKILLIFKFSTESYFKRIWKILKSCNSSTSHLKSIKTAKEIIPKYDTLLQQGLSKLTLGQMAIFANKSRRIYTEMTPHQSWLTNIIKSSTHPCEEPSTLPLVAFLSFLNFLQNVRTYLIQ